MKIKILPAVALLIAIAIIGCKDDNPILNDNFNISSSDVTFDGTTLRFECERQTISIDVTTESNEGKWNAYCPTNDLWCSFSLRGGQLILTVALNNTNIVRSTWIEFVCGENKQRIYVVQDYQRVLYFPSGNSAVVGAAPHSEKVPLMSNIPTDRLSANVSNPVGCDWITDLDVSTTALTFKMLRNPSFTETRTATITVTGDDKTASIVITQNALTGHPYIINISGANFSDCYIYEIWDDANNVKVGELCKEYLHKHPDGVSEASVRMQTVVAYPMANGKIDLANGLVIENGYFLAWNPNITVATPPYDMLASYVEGETVTATPTIIYFDQGASRMSTYEIEDFLEPAVYATLRPYLLNDQRSGAANTAGNTTENYTYKIVKIGSQYWMAENLRTSRFRDGANIPTNISNTNWMTPPGGEVGTPGCLVNSSYLDANASGGASTRAEFGLLYNYCAIVNKNAMANVAMTNLQDMLSPEGWHVPAKAQLEILRNYTSQSTLAAVVIPELDAGATGNFGNATGFGMKGTVQRGQNGGWNNGNTHLASMDYAYDASQTANNYALQHGYYSIRMEPVLSNFLVPSTSVTHRGSNYYTCRAGNYIRCLRND